MYKAMLTAAVVVLPLFAAATPAFAMKGIDAARACNNKPGCILLLDDAGGATIIDGDVIIDCPGPQQDCSVVGRAQPKPHNELMGEIPQSLGTFSSGEDSDDNGGGNGGGFDHGDVHGDFGSMSTFDTGSGGAIIR